MAEETPAEAAPVEEVAPASAAPQEAESSPDYVSKSDFTAGLEAYEERIVNRLKQSTGDKVKAAVSSEMSEKMSGLDKAVELLRPLMREDVSEEDVALVKERQFIRDLMAGSSSEPEVESEAPSQAEVPEPASSPPGFQDEIQSILDTTGVSGEEPELLEYAEKNKGKPWYQTGPGFEELAKSIAARSAGTSAGVVASQGQVANTDLVQDFHKELDALQNPRDSEGNLLPGRRRGSMEQLRQLQQKHRELGVSEEDLDISEKGQAGLRTDWFPPTAT